MELVINRCYGGFGLSQKAVMQYAKYKGIKLYVYSELLPNNVTEDIDNKSYPFVHYLTKKLDMFDSKEIGRTYFSPSDIERDDETLLKIVKELGEQANGYCAELHIVEIPDDVNWIIEENDGYEWVAEAHRTW